MAQHPNAQPVLPSVATPPCGCTTSTSSGVVMYSTAPAAVVSKAMPVMGAEHLWTTEIFPARARDTSPLSSSTVPSTRPTATPARPAAAAMAVTACAWASFGVRATTLTHCGSARFANVSHTRRYGWIPSSSHCRQHRVRHTGGTRQEQTLLTPTETKKSWSGSCNRWDTRTLKAWKTFPEKSFFSSRMDPSSRPQKTRPRPQATAHTSFCVGL